MEAASVVLVFVFLFTDEFWWVGIHLEAVNVWSVAAVAVLGASWYVPLFQKLSFREMALFLPDPGRDPGYALELDRLSYDCLQRYFLKIMLPAR